jgi:DNA repair protein RadC
MTSPSERSHRFVTIEQVVRAEQPESADLATLFDKWGLTHSTQEAFWVIAIDSIENVKTVVEVARGGFHDVVVHLPTVLAAVLSAHSDRFYVAHNHPAGAIEPTMEDIHLTAEVMAAANAAGLSFEDHFIVGPSGRFSFWEAGLLTRAESLGTRAALKRGGRKRGR